MKKNTTLLLVFIASLLSFHVSATTYTYAGGWDANGAPVSPLGNSDAIIINSGTYVQSGFLKLKSNSSVYIAAGATWKVQGTDTLENRSSNFVVDGTLLLKSSAYFYNRTSTAVLTINGAVKLKNSSFSKNSLNSFIHVNDGGKWVMFSSTLMENKGKLAVFGTLKTKSSSVFTNKGMIVGTGIINLISTTSFINTSGNASVNQCNGSSCLTSGANDLGATLGAPTAMTATINSTSTVPASLSCSDLYVVDSNQTITGDVEIGVLEITSGNTLTVASGGSLTICYSIVNAGNISMENGSSLKQNSTTNTNVVYGGNYSVSLSAGQQSKDLYNIWSSPVADADLISTFPSTNPCAMYVFNGSTQEWAYDFLTGSGTYYCGGNPVDFASFLYSDGGTPDGLMDAGRGYYIPGDSTVNTERIYSGEINNGTITVNAYSTNIATNPSAWGGNDWNLIGNPYPSSIDPAAFMTTNGSKLTDGLYFWDETIGDYQVYASTGATTPTGFKIAVGQGFYVITDDAVVLDGTSTTLDFENSMRDISGGSFYKVGNSENHNIGYSVSTPSGELNKIIVGYSANSTDGVDKLTDAHKLSGNANIRFASLLNNEEFIIQGIASPNYGETKNIPLLVFTTETGNHTFSEFKNENIPSGMNVYLKDNATNVMYDLSKGDYSVHLDGNQEYKSRFELVFENVSVKDTSAQTDKGTNEKGEANEAGEANEITGVKDLNNSNWNLATSEHIFTLSNSNGINGTIQVIDVMGRAVFTKTNSSNSSEKIDLSNVNSGVYFIQVVENDQRVYINKIVNP